MVKLSKVLRRIRSSSFDDCYLDSTVVFIRNNNTQTGLGTTPVVSEIDSHCITLICTLRQTPYITGQKKKKGEKSEKHTNQKNILKKYYRQK